MKSCEKELMGKSGLYAIINEFNGNWYVGSTKNSFSKRFSRHVELLRKNKHSNPHLQRAYNKYGEDKFCFVVVKVLGHSKAIKEEQKVLDLNFGKPHCYNICSDAKAPMSGRKHTPETITKLQIISKSRAKEIGECTRIHRLGSKHTEKTIRRMKKSAKARDDSNRIVVLKSKEFRDKMSKTMTGRKLTDEQLENQRKTMQSKKYRENMSKATSGIPKSEVMKSKASFARMGRKIYLIKDSYIEEVLSLRNFCHKYKIDRHEISSLVNGKRDEYKGWKLKV